MKLSFRSQFMLAPFIIAILMAGMVAYTLFEISIINRENNNARDWEILTDKIQTAIAATTHLHKIIDEMPARNTSKDDDQYFAYLEHSKILSESLMDLAQLSQISPKLRELIDTHEPIYRKPDIVKPKYMTDSIHTLLPALKHQYKLFASQRRTAIVDNNLGLVSISYRLTGVLILAFIFSLILASSITFIGLKNIRRRLKDLVEQAYDMCTAATSLLPASQSTNKNVNNQDDIDVLEGLSKLDELDELNVCLEKISKRVFSVVSVEKALHNAEDERRRIALDIHDGVLADLTVLTRNINSLVLPSDDDKAVQTRLGTLRKDVDGAIKNLRRIIDDLHPQLLDTRGLELALHSFMGRYDLGSGFPKHKFDFDKNIERKLTNDQKLSLFRIIIEAINNVIQHSRCEHFEVSLRIVGLEIIVSVEDNGIGIDEKIDTKGKGKGHGYAYITERARLIGSTVQWRESRFVSGTNFELTMPLSQTSHAPP